MTARPALKPFSFATLGAIALVGAGVAALSAGCNSPSSGTAAKAEPKVDPTKRGEVLVHAGSCNDCHTPMRFDEKLGMPVPEMDRMLSGHPEGAHDPASTLAEGDQAVIGPTFTSFKLPFGVVYAANITPDTETGIGAWSEQQFIATMRSGQHLGLRGRPVLPPMPWMNLRELSDDDLRALWTYLRSIPPVKNRVPQPAVPAPVYAEITKGYDAVLAAARP
jgi:hypothetical protein